jgi:hypothetical protein
MNPMNAAQRLEHAFLAWLLNYKEHEWSNLTMEEKYALADFHYEKFADELKCMTKMGDWPWFQESEEKE